MNTTKFSFERFEQEKERLASLRKYESLVDDSDEDLHQLVKIAAFICQAPISLVNLVEANHTIFKAAVGTDMKGSPREISFCSKAIMGSGVFEIPDAALDDRFKDNPLVTGDNRIRFYAGAPLVNKEGMSMGTLCVFDQNPKVLSSQQKEALETLSRMAVMVMENRKQAAIVHKGNLSAVISLENKVSELTTQLESFRKFLPLELASKLAPNNLPVESFTVSKDMVVLQCALQVAPDDGPIEISFIHKIYELIARIVTTYNGIVHHFDGHNISALFSEPLSTFPYEENALYCAFDLNRQFDELLQKENFTSRLHLATTIHGGAVQSGVVSLPGRIDYTMSGKIVEESKLIRDEVITKSSAVVISSQFLDKVSNAVAIVEKHMITRHEITLEAYEIKLTR